MIEQLKNFTACERGNILLTYPESGDFTAYYRLPDGGWLEMDYRRDNYPCLEVATINLTDEQLATHINTKLVGMYVQKGNIDGLHIDTQNCIDERNVKTKYNPVEVF